MIARCNECGLIARTSDPVLFEDWAVSDDEDRLLMCPACLEELCDPVEEQEVLQ